MTTGCGPLAHWGRQTQLEVGLVLKYRGGKTFQYLLAAKISQPKGTLRCLIIRHYLNSCIWNKIALESTPQLLNKIGQVTFTMVKP